MANNIKKNAKKGGIAGIASCIATLLVTALPIDDTQRAALVPVIAALIVAGYDAIKHAGKKDIAK